MSLFSKLFGGGSAPPKVQPVHHEGFVIYPEPIKETGAFRVAARIEKEIAGEVKVHEMIRADTYQSEEAATEGSVFKARQMIDQMGDRIFD